MPSKFAKHNPGAEMISYPPQPLWRSIASRVGSYVFVAVTMFAAGLVLGEDWREYWKSVAVFAMYFIAFDALWALLKPVLLPEFLLRPPPASAGAMPPQTSPLAYKIVAVLIVVGIGTIAAVFHFVIAAGKHG